MCIKESTVYTRPCDRRCNCGIIFILFHFYGPVGRSRLIYTRHCSKADFYHSKCSRVLTETYFERVDKGTKTESKWNCHANEYLTILRVFKEDKDAHSAILIFLFIALGEKNFRQHNLDCVAKTKINTKTQFSSDVNSNTRLGLFCLCQKGKNLLSPSAFTRSTFIWPASGSQSGNLAGDIFHELCAFVQCVGHQLTTTTAPRGNNVYLHLNGNFSLDKQVMKCCSMHIEWVGDPAGVYSSINNKWEWWCLLRSFNCVAFVNLTSLQPPGTMKLLNEKWKRKRVGIHCNNTKGRAPCQKFVRIHWEKINIFF